MQIAPPSALLYYALHGRVAASTCALPFLPTHAPTEPDLILRLRVPPVTPLGPLLFDSIPWYTSDLTTSDGGPSLVVDRNTRGDFIIRFADGTAFRVAGNGSCIEDLLSAPAHYTDGDIAAYALGPVMAVALHAMGAILLHASAVAFKGRAILFAGHSGSGKSTTAAILHRQNYTVLSDDLTEISAQLGAVPSYPGVRLWPEAMRMIYGSEGTLTDHAPSWEKKTIPSGDPGTTPREIAAILFLEPDNDWTTRLERIAPKEAWKRLMAHSFTAHLPDPSMAKRLLERMTQLANRVPMYSFAPPSITDSRRLGTFLERELEDQLR